MKDPDSITVSVRVVPRASKSEIAETSGGLVRIRLAAPPVDGAANAELIKLLASEFRVPRRDVEIVSGASSRTKRVRISGINADAAPAWYKDLER